MLANILLEEGDAIGARRKLDEAQGLTKFSCVAAVNDRASRRNRARRSVSTPSRTFSAISRPSS